MSARGSLSCGKFFAESANYIPPIWLALLDSADCKDGFCGPFTMERKSAIYRAEAVVPFLTTVFTEFSDFDSIAYAFLERLTKLRSKSIVIDINELMPDANYLFADALSSIENQTNGYKRKVKASIEVDPDTGFKYKIPAANYKSTRELILDICWMTSWQLEMDDEERQDFVVGYAWK